MKKLYPPGVSHDDRVIEELRANEELAVAMLQAVMEEVDEEGGEYALRKTLHMIAKTQGLGKIAKKAGIPRESLSRALSARGNPRFSTLKTIVDAMGMKLAIVPAGRN